VREVVHHSDRGSQYLSIKYFERLAEAGVEPSVGSIGDSYDNALAETLIGLFKTGVIHHRGPWRSGDAVEYATLEWVDRFNNRRLLESNRQRTPGGVGDAAPSPMQRVGHADLTQHNTTQHVSGEPGAVHRPVSDKA
jgi:transposase InsO family protein